MAKDIALRPSYWASVSGGKDSLYMLNLILHNLDKYPLDGVVHYELEIDFPFIHDVIDYMESECKKHGIVFKRIKPRKTWEELFYSTRANGERRLFPIPKGRWCLDKYKLDAQKQLDEWLESNGMYCVQYIGYCFDEEKRYSKRKSKKITERYPLVEEGILEDDIWAWAKTQPIFNHYYETLKRCGCMLCPMISRINAAYICKYYPDKWEYMLEKMRETEREREKESVANPSRYMQPIRNTMPIIQRTLLKQNGLTFSMRKNKNLKGVKKMEEEITQAMLDEFENAKGDDEDE